MTNKSEQLVDKVQALTDDKGKEFDEAFKAFAEEDAGPPREANIAPRLRSIAARMMKHTDPEVRSMAAEILEHVKVLERR